MEDILQIAIDSNNNLVSIYQVPTGIKCKCTCPECGEILEAKNSGKDENTILRPNQKRAHFAHASGKVCANTRESALHLLAKEVLAKHKTLMLPNVYERLELVGEARRFTFDSVELEKAIVHNGFRIIPDAILSKGKKKLYVEFYKSHLVDNEKLDKIKSIGVSALEIDLNDVELIVDGIPNREGIKNFLENDAGYRDWLFNTQGEKLYRIKENSANKPKYSLEFLKKQDIEYEAEINEILERQEKSKYFEENRKSFQNWVKKKLEFGSKLIKVYNFKEQESVFCPKEPKSKNKIPLYNCTSCPHYLSPYYGVENESVLS